MSSKAEELSGVLQRRYGYNKAKADTYIDNWLKEAGKKSHTKHRPASSSCKTE